MILSLLLAAYAAADTCSLESGNYYCSQVELVEYENVGFSGTYNRVTSFNSDGSCSSTQQSFSGSLSPFDEELSVHFRGPIQLENFAVYTKSSSSQRKRALHHRHAEPEPVYVTATTAVTEFVTVDQFGNLVTATEAETSPATTSVEDSSVVTGSAIAAVAVAATVSSAEAVASAAGSTVGSASGAQSTAETSSASSTSAPINNYNYNHLAQSSATGPSVVTYSSSSTSAAAASSSTSAVADGSSWSQIASYSASAGSADGLVFLNNMGGAGSGVFDYTFGNSLSYCGSDGVSCASSPETLSQTTVPSDKEFIIFTDNECSGDSCGYSRPGTVAYHGFDGNYKVFLFEFSMPTESSVSSSTYNYDMPAVWLLNAQIPRTLQYGASDCSCWESGCGELDLFEVLNAGNDKLTNHLHDKQDGSGGGTGDYFARPTEGTLTAAAIFNGDKLSIVQLDEFPSSVSDSDIAQWIDNASGSTVVSL